MYCINERNPEFIALANKSVQPNDVLKAKISIWQEENNTDEFPTLDQIGIEEISARPIQQIENRIEQLRKEEQAEYDAMFDSSNQTIKDEIYNRYDKLITPLLNKAKPESRIADMDKATKFLQEKLGMTTDEIVRVTGLIDNDTFGRMLTDGKIVLSDLMEVGTEYHEAFHRVWNFYLNPQERQLVLEDFKKDPKYKEKIEYLKESYPKLEENDLIEEHFAEDFRDFMMSEATPKTVIEKMYDKIIKFLSKLVGISPKNINELYNMIAGGRFAKSTKLVERTYVDKNRAVTINGVEIKLDSEYVLIVSKLLSIFLNIYGKLKSNQQKYSLLNGLTSIVFFINSIFEFIRNM